MERQRKVLIVRFAMLVAAALLVAGLVVGCGSGGGGDETGSTDSASKAAGGSADSAGGEAAPESSAEGGSGAPEVAESSLSKAEFVKRANALCSKERTKNFKQLTVFAGKHAAEGKPESTLLKDLVREVLLPRIEREIAGIAELGAPAGERAQVEAILEAQQKAVDEAAELANPKTLAQVESYFAKAGAMAKAYGISTCDNSSAPPAGGN